MWYGLCNFAHLWKRGKMGCFEMQISAVCWWLTAHFCNNKSKNAFICFWGRGRFHRPSTLPFFLKEFRWLSHSFFHCWLLVFGFDRRTKEHIWVWPILLWNLCTCVWSFFYFGFWLFYMSCWTCFSISLRAYIYSLYLVRSWTKFRMTLCMESCWTCLTLFNLLTLTLSSSSLQGIVCKHPLLLSRSSVRHSSSKLDSALA